MHPGRVALVPSHPLGASDKTYVPDGAPSPSLVPVVTATLSVPLRFEPSALAYIDGSTDLPSPQRLYCLSPPSLLATVTRPDGLFKPR